MCNNVMCVISRVQMLLGSNRDILISNLRYFEPSGLRSFTRGVSQGNTVTTFYLCIRSYTWIQIAV